MAVILMTVIFTTCWIGCTQKSDSIDAASTSTEASPLRIVSLSGTVSETLVALGCEDAIVAVDVTSTYPPSLAALPNVGHNRNISLEGVLSQTPTHVVALEGQLTMEAQEQIRGAGAELMILEQQFSIEGTEFIVSELADAFGKEDSVANMLHEIRLPLQQIQPINPAPKVLFVYARGAGTLMVAGDNTQMNKMIELAGGINVATGFNDFKPLTPEALVAAAPDIILMFDSGVSSLEGMEGVKALPGVSATPAGKFNQFISMEGQYLAGFGPRLGQAVAELNASFQAIELQQNSTPVAANAH